MRPFIRFPLHPLPFLPHRRCISRAISPSLLVGPTNSCGDRLHLSRAITLIESSRESHRSQARSLLQQALAIAPPERLSSSFRIGISGPPGVGKSSFIERLGMLLVSKGTKVAVLAIDPSSAVSGGSILGDKTRMVELSHHEHAYVRPSPTGGMLGGLAQHTDEVVQLCEAAGYSHVIVETVGVGQSEIDVQQVCDIMVLLLPPAGGDSLQGIKRGIVETADLIAVTKADGDTEPAAQRARSEYAAALQYMRPKHSWWKPKVRTISSANGAGIEQLWEDACAFRERGGSGIKVMRGEQRGYWMWAEAGAMLERSLKTSPRVLRRAQELQAQLASSTITSQTAAAALVQEWKNECNSAV